MEQTTAIHPALSSTLAGNQCPVCGATLAEDQRYCVECGERRGEPRLPVMDLTRPAAPPPEKAPRRITPGTTLVAGVATLLLAIGVGVLIGRAGDKTTSTRANAPVQVVTVAGGGGATGAAAAGTTAAAGGKAVLPKTSHALKKARKLTTAQKAKVAAQSNAAVNKVLKPTKAAGKLPPATVKVGQPGSGRGYKNGKFTGDFFGG